MVPKYPLFGNTHGQSITCTSDTDRPETELISFDVFDTVLVRRLGGPIAVFPRLAENVRRHGLDVGPENSFVITRNEVERQLTAARGRPPTLMEIWDEVVLLLGLPSEIAEELAAEEMDLDRSTCVPVPDIERVLRNAREHSDQERLLFVSDTPHSETFVRELLMRAALIRDDDLIFTSADRKATKSTGRLYDIVAEFLGVAPGQIIHSGDNVRSDVGVARLRGWRSQPRTQARFNRYESLLDTAGPDTAGLTSLLAGSSRVARLEAVAAGDNAALAAVAAGVAAPMLIGYALWVAAQARTRGIGCLYFVSRDGQVMLDVARPILARVAPEIECRYLYGSRQAWQFATLDLDPGGLKQWMSVQSGVTGSAALARVGLAATNVWEESRMGFASPDRMNQPLSASDRRALLEYVQRPAVWEDIRRASHDQADRAAAYIVQEGFGTSGPYGLVDVGWAGRTAGSFDLLLNYAGLPPAVHFMIGLSELAKTARHLPPAPPPALVAWLFDRDERRGVEQNLWGLRSLVEMFCAGTEGRLLRYDAEDERIIPAVTQPRNQAVIDWGLPAVRRAIERVASLTAEELPATALHTNLTQIVWRGLKEFWTRPTSDEGAVWGAFPWEGETEPQHTPLAHAVTAAGVLNAMRRRGTPFRRPDSWRAGSAIVSHQPWRSIIALSAWQEDFDQRARAGWTRHRIKRAVRK